MQFTNYRDDTDKKLPMQPMVYNKSGTTNNKEFYVYVNGVLQAGFAPIANVPQLYKFNSNFVIGGGGMASKYFKGYIDEFYIYNRALEQTEIAAVRDNTTAPVLGTETIENESSITIYPNPATTVLNVVGTAVDKVEVYNLQGQKVMTGFTGSFVVEHLHSGVYLVRITNTEGVVTVQRFIKK